MMELVKKIKSHLDDLLGTVPKHKDDAVGSVLTHLLESDPDLGFARAARPVEHPASRASSVPESPTTRSRISRF